MTQPEHATVQNRLLRAFPTEDFDMLKPDLHLMEMQLKQVLISPRAPSPYLYFPETGFASVTAESGSFMVEVGLIGREGLVGCSLLMLGIDHSPYAHFTQMAGSVFRISADAMQAAVDESPSLRRLLLRFVHIELLQARQTAFVNASYITEIRLARWLLMCHDRVDGDEITITHEFLSIMLGVQRGGVTLALQNLEGAGRIRARRGRITVTDRELLVALAGGSYGTAEAEYARLIEGR